MITKKIEISLNIDGTSTLPGVTEGKAPVLISEELNSTVLNVKFPENFRTGYKYSCCVEGYEKQFVLSALNADGVTEFILPEVKRDTVKIGFCAYSEEQDKITKYVKWQGVQFTVINGGEKYVDL